MRSGADFSKNEADNSYRTNGTKDGVETYYASLTDDGKMLGIWTKDDDEAARTMPNLDTPPLASVIGSNEKRTGEITAGQTPSIDSGLTSKISQPEVQAHATSRPPSQRPNRAPRSVSVQLKFKKENCLKRKARRNNSHIVSRCRSLRGNLLH